MSEDRAPIPDYHDSKEAQYEDQIRLTALFGKLDVDSDGFIDLEEMKNYMAKQGQYGNRTENMAMDIIQAGDIKKDGKLDYQEFMLYMINHERKLWTSFKKLDKDGNGSVGMDDLECYCKEHGITLNTKERHALLKRIDQDGNLQIEWEEWREFHQFSPPTYFDSVLSGLNAGALGMPGEIVTVTQEGKKVKATGDPMGWFICGGIAGAVSRTTTAPLDRVKVILQVQGSQKILGQTKKLGFRSAFSTMYSEGGLLSLWRGNSVNCFKIVPENAARLLFFEYLLTYVDAKNAGISTKFLCGAGTGVAVQTIMYPLEVVKTRIMISSSVNQADRKVAAVWRSLGTSFWGRFLGLYRGLSPALIGIVPFSGIELCINRTASDWICKRRKIQYPGVQTALVVGFSSTGIAMSCTYPLRLITTQLQANKAEQSPKAWDIFTKILRVEGVKGLYRGFMPNAVKVLPASGVSWATYHQAMKYYDKSKRHLINKY